MPASTFFGGTLTNLGSVVTPFTAAPSCTSISNHAVAIQGSADDYTIVGYPDCNAVSVSGCIPYGSDADKLVTTERRDFSPTLAYYSPGLVCPSGWTTAGTIVGPSGWSSASGVFTQPHFPYQSGGHFPLNVAAVDYLVGALEPSETMAWCCPSGMKAMGRAFGCFSSVEPVESYSSYSGVCRAFYTEDVGFDTVSTFEGSVYTQGVYSPISFTKDVSPSTEYDTDLLYYPTTEETILVSASAALIMIHKEEDATLTGSSTAMTTANGGKGQQSGKNNSTGGDNGGDDESGARRLTPTADGLWSIAPVALAAGSVFIAMLML